MRSCVRRLVLGSGIASVLVVSPAGAEPIREGFTMEVGIGLAWTQYDDVWYTVSSTDGESIVRERTSKFGLAPLSLSLGGFLSPDLAMMARMAGTSYFDGDDQLVNSFYGVVVQYWLNDVIFVGGGPGFAVYGPNAFVSRSSVDPVAGFGVNARLGAMPASNEEHGFGVVFELFPSWYAEEMVVGAALNLQWQLY